MENVRIAGVPEHFNLPWHMAMEEGAFAEKGIALHWTDVPEGSGRMAEMLRRGETDLAVILTDGFLKAAADGLQAVILQEYVASPLLWGIHVAAGSSYQTPSELKGQIAAISRPGSGSQLMAYVHAREMGWKPEDVRFEVVHTLDGAIKALSEGQAAYFLWERFTTQPVVDQGVFRRIGQCPTPWPCFILVARSEYAARHKALLDNLREILNTYTREFRNIPSIDRTLANRYGQRLEEVQSWLGLTRWSQQQVSLQSLEKTIITLSELKLLSNTINAKDLLA